MSFPNFVPAFLLMKKKNERQRSTSLSLTHSHIKLNFVVYVSLFSFVEHTHTRVRVAYSFVLCYQLVLLPHQFKSFCLQPRKYISYLVLFVFILSCSISVNSCIYCQIFFFPYFYRFLVHQISKKLPFVLVSFSCAFRW